MKRLQKGQKYFDSGDYNMAKAKMKNKQLPSAGPDKNLVTGDHIPTPQDLPQRKSSLVTSKLAGRSEWSAWGCGAPLTLGSLTDGPGSRRKSRQVDVMD
ncbi:alpha-endosulfine isoform X3 [Ochotona princeps]|nr:alpha-endosulfine isoform X3 [Ochotona princeps]